MKFTLVQKPTEFFFDYDELMAKFHQVKKQYESQHPGSNYSEDIFAITDQYAKDEKLNYLKFGPYWWAVKYLLDKQGFKNYILAEANRDVLNAYLCRDKAGNIDAFATLVAAWQFKDFYNSYYFQGNRDFDLWGTGETFCLVDRYWEFDFDFARCGFDGANFYDDDEEAW